MHQKQVSWRSSYMEKLSTEGSLFSKKKV